MAVEFDWMTVFHTAGRGITGVEVYVILMFRNLWAHEFYEKHIEFLLPQLMHCQREFDRILFFIDRELRE